MSENEEVTKPVIVTHDLRFVRGDGTDYLKRSGQEEVEVKSFTSRPAVVRRSYGMTINMGNYESARVEVGVEVPCYIEDVELADEWAANFCESRITEEVVGLRKDKSGSDKPSY